MLGSAFAACGGAKPDSGFENPDGGGALGDGASGGSLGGDGSGGGTGNQAGCSDAAKLVYVVDSTNGLHSFNPATLTFTTIGELHCPTSFGFDATPNSMAVDRSGTAWVNFSDGELFKVSTSDASCTATSFDPSQNPSGGSHWGMAFSTNGATSTDETLFTDPGDGSGDGTGLYSYDTAGNKLTKIGNFSDGLKGTEAELTGTGDGRLFAFLTTDPATVAEVTKTDGTTPSSAQAPLDGVSTGMAWAFSFWGGDFWLYTSQNGVSSSVTQYKTSSDKSVTVVVNDTFFAIVGAGVSTCAPTAPPR
ncbi:MAG: hypothetical protein ACRELY_17515 [Polyangiaceae bacterium]